MVVSKGAVQMMKATLDAYLYIYLIQAYLELYLPDLIYPQVNLIHILLLRFE